jgi:hypothetical protein
MGRYYKFLIINILVFFCVGTAALQSVLDSFKAGQTSSVDILHIVADSFPTAGPFYVGWRKCFGILFVARFLSIFSHLQRGHARRV